MYQTFFNNSEQSTDRTITIPTSNRISTWLKSHKKKLLYFSVAIILLISIAIVIYFAVFYGRVRLIVFEFNVWGMPGGIGGCQFKKERMKALAKIIKSREPYFDVFLLAELWMQKDHEILQEAANQAGLYMTGFRELANR